MHSGPCLVVAAVARQLAERSVGRLAPGIARGRPMQGRRVGGYPEVPRTGRPVVLGLARISLQRRS